jgi:hypothetical protein
VSLLCLQGVNLSIVGMVVLNLLDDGVGDTLGSVSAMREGFTHGDEPRCSVARNGAGRDRRISTETRYPLNIDIAMLFHGRF